MKYRYFDFEPIWLKLGMDVDYTLKAYHKVYFLVNCIVKMLMYSSSICICYTKYENKTYTKEYVKKQFRYKGIRSLLAKATCMTRFKKIELAR